MGCICLTLLSNLMSRFLRRALFKSLGSLFNGGYAFSVPGNMYGTDGSRTHNCKDLEAAAGTILKQGM